MGVNKAKYREAKVMKIRNMILITLLILTMLAMPSTASATNGSDYFVYSELDTGYTGSYGADGYVGVDGVDRIIFYNESTAYIYTVTIPEGDEPNMHPDNPEATGPVAPRTFTFDKEFDLGVSPGHQCEFYVDEESNVIYLGASVGIKKYVFDETADNYVYDSDVAPSSPTGEGFGTQSLAYDPGNDTWYAGSIALNYDPGVTERKMWKYDGSQGNSGSWGLAFTYTTSEGASNHHDGLEFIAGYLWLADYMGDYIKKYATDGTEIEVFLHDPLDHELEGMGFGALGHFWCGSHGSTITEFGGGTLIPAIEVEIDIKPGSDPNSINLKGNGVIPVAILTTDTFDAADVDPETARFGPDEAMAVQSALEDVDDDGDVDLILHFKTQEVGLTEDSTEATLTGQTFGGDDITGTDSVRIVPPKKK